MKKADPTKVNPALARMAIARAKDRQSVYSQCVIGSFRMTGKLDCGFTNQDLQAWIDQNAIEQFTKKGIKIITY